MLQILKENYFIRSFLYKLLKNYEAKRRIKGTNYYLLFDAGTNFNFFFKNQLEIEREAAKNLTKLVAKNFIVFDIGANIGYYTVLLSSYCNECKIIAFEPDKSNLRYLRKNVELNGLQNVLIIDKAVSNKITEKIFYQDLGTGRTSSLNVDAWHPNAAKVKQQTVQTTTIN